MKFRTDGLVAKHNVNLLKSSESTICFNFLGQSAWPYAACVVICFSEDTQHLEAAGRVMNGRQFAIIC